MKWRIHRSSDTDEWIITASWRGWAVREAVNYRSRLDATRGIRRNMAKKLKEHVGKVGSY